MALRCISQVRNNAGFWTPGVEVADPALEGWLLRDSPGSWELVGVVDEGEAEDFEVSEKAVATPPQDKAIKPSAVTNRGRWATKKE